MYLNNKSLVFVSCHVTLSERIWESFYDVFLEGNKERQFQWGFYLDSFQIWSRTL